MTSTLCLFFLVAICLITRTYAFPHHVYRRQLYPLKKHDLSHKERSARVDTPSGSIMGTYYYGVGSDPNYGSFIQAPNSPNGGILPISYNPDSSLYNYLINPNYQQQQQQQPYYLPNNNNAWQSSNMNNYNNQPYNRYPPGSAGWYATGGNYWYNKGQSLSEQSCLLFMGILVLIICK